MSNHLHWSLVDLSGTTPFKKACPSLEAQLSVSPQFWMKAHIVPLLTPFHSFSFVCFLQMNRNSQPSFLCSNVQAVSFSWSGQVWLQCMFWYCPGSAVVLLTSFYCFSITILFNLLSLLLPAAQFLGSHFFFCICCCCFVSLRFGFIVP